MNRIFVGVLAVLTGLLFYCPKAYACDDILPKEGFQEFIADIEIGEDEMGKAGCDEEEPNDFPAYYISPEDQELLLDIAALEAGNQGVEGMAYVIQTVLNRVFDSRFPTTVEGVLFQKNQFTTAERLKSANVTDETREALRLVTEGNYKWSESLYFESLEGVAWANCHEYLFTYGGHDFYK